MTTTHDERIYEALSIEIGVPKAPNDANSAEVDLITLNLMSGGPGFTVDNALSGWNPAIAQSKAGVWADTATFDGRVPQALPVQNVIETLNLTCVGSSWVEVNEFYNDLMRFIRRAREFWVVQSQIEPVYLRWWAVGASGPQYALIYNINAAPMRASLENSDGQKQYDVTLTIEREPAWRWEVAPGDNPKRWSTREVTGNTVGYFNLVTWNGTGIQDYHIAETTTAKNKHEYDVGTDYSTILTRNYIDVPAESIPGDAPALVFLALNATPPFGGTSANRKVYLGVKSTNLQRTSIDGNTVHLANTLNAGDLTTGGTLVTDPQTGGVIRGMWSIGTGTPNYFYRTLAPASGGGTASLTWNPDIAQTDGGNLDINMLRGTWMVFVRNRFISGAQGDIDLQLDISEYADTTQQLPTVTLTGEAQFQSGANIADWGVTYMGTVTLPLSRKALARYAVGWSTFPSPQQLAYNSSGLHIGDATNSGLPSEDGTLQIVLTATNNAGAARTLAVGDIVLMPIDEYAVAVIVEEGMAFLLSIDTTTYSTHGDPQPTAISGGVQSNQLVSQELRGSGLYLKPGADNRIFGLVTSDTGGLSDISPADTDLNMIVNIVPRSYGARDQ